MHQLFTGYTAWAQEDGPFLIRVYLPRLSVFGHVLDVVQ